MPTTRQRLAGSAQDKQQRHSRDMRQSKLALFIQQVEKEAQERMNELESKLENMLATVDKVFKVELMKMPPPLQNTLLCDLISEEEVPASEVSIAMKSESREIDQPLRRIPSRRIKSTDSSPVEVQRSSSKALKAGKRAKKIQTLAGSNSTGNLIPSSASIRRAQSFLTNRKTTEQMAPNQTKRKLRSVMSASDLPCSMAGSAAHVTVMTARGELSGYDRLELPQDALKTLNSNHLRRWPGHLTVSFSEETKDDINWDLLDDVAWCQIQKLTRLMEYLSQKSRCQR